MALKASVVHARCEGRTRTQACAVLGQASRNSLAATCRALHASTHSSATLFYVSKVPEMLGATGLAHPCQANTQTLQANRASQHQLPQSLTAAFWGQQGMLRPPKTCVQTEGSPQKLGGLQALRMKNKPQTVLADA